LEGWGSLPDGRWSTEAGKAITEPEQVQSEGTDGSADSGHERLLSVLEAVLLTVVAVLAAWFSRPSSVDGRRIPDVPIIHSR
jgi:hypothetical protein